MSSATDTNYTSYADQDGVMVDGRSYDPREADLKLDKISDTLKFSHLTNSVFVNCVVIGSKENAVDANRFCRNVRVVSSKLFGGDQAAIVVKGGCALMVFEHIEITPSLSAWCDVLWDDFSDQSSQPSTGRLINVSRTDGKPVRVVFGRLVRPTIIGGNCKIDWVRSIGLHAYNYCWKGPLRALRIL